MPPTPNPEPPSVVYISWSRAALGFAHRHHRTAVLFVLALVLYACGLSITAQLLYPANYTLPGTRLAGTFMGIENAQAVHTVLERLDDHVITLTLAQQTYHVTPDEAGVTFANTANIQTVLTYPFNQRVIPFSLFLQRKIFVQDDLRPSFNLLRLKTFATELANKSQVQAVEGSVAIVNGTVVEQAPKSGSSPTIHEIITKFLQLTGDLPATLAISGQTIPPQYSLGAVRAAAIRATHILKPFIITINGSSYVVPAATVGSWLTFTPDPAKKAIDVGTNQTAVAKYLDTIAKGHYVAPKITTVTLLDGHEVSRQAGSPGTYVSTSNGASVVADALTKDQSATTLYLAPVGSPVHYVRQYSNSQAGLQALLNYLVASKGTYGITVHEISTRGWSASASGNRSFVTASTYKLFVAYSTLKRIENGTFHWTDSTHGTTLSTCFGRMIIFSDNDCAIAMGERIGWSAVIGEVNKLGLASTSSSDTFYSTSNDEALFLTQQLAIGKILNGTDRALLISLMEQQHYRSGIPAGTGVLVADKVGFLWSLLNDAAIVYSPHSTYVLVIMTDHSSWARIADTAKQIEAQMAR